MLRRVLLRRVLLRRVLLRVAYCCAVYCAVYCAAYCAAYCCIRLTCLDIKQRLSHIHLELTNDSNAPKAFLVQGFSMDKGLLHNPKELHLFVEGFMASTGTPLEISNCRLVM